MARRVDNECAWCAELIPDEMIVVGSDRKLYCSEDCRCRGEQISLDELRQIMSCVFIGRRGESLMPG